MFYSPDENVYAKNYRNFKATSDFNVNLLYDSINKGLLISKLFIYMFLIVILN